MTLPQYSFRLVFAACTIGLISHADIVLRDKNNSVAVVYQDDADTKVYYRRCLDSLPQDKLWRNCNSSEGPAFPRSRSHYFLSALRLKKIQEAFVSENALEALVLAIEQFTRLEDGSQSEEGKKYLEDLRRMRDRTVEVNEEWMTYLAQGKDRVLVEGVHDDYGDVLSAFTDLWSDGKGRVWRILSPASWNAQASACGKFWKPVALKDLTGDKTNQLRSDLSKSYLVTRMSRPVVWTADEREPSYGGDFHGVAVILGSAGRLTGGAMFHYYRSNSTWIDSGLDPAFPVVDTQKSNLLPILCWR